ncbi:hypothetical protein HJFPF1_01888 [Paramyrothecium foliicola]|nr:hypothetical protein HJFPF1_01888 [Paramyrothecium foliicola]
MSSRSSSAASLNRRQDPLLPYSNIPEKAQFRARSILGHSLYRRVLIWSCVSLLFVGFALFHRRDRAAYDVAPPPFTTVKPPSVRIHEDHDAAVTGQTEANGGNEPVVVNIPEIKENTHKMKKPLEAPKAAPKEAGKTTSNEAGKETAPLVKEPKEGKPKGSKAPAAEGKADKKVEEGKASGELPSEEPQEQPEGAPWLNFKHLNAYFFGLKTLVSKSEHEAEYPNPARPTPFSQPPTSEDIPKPKPYNPYKSSDIVTCYLDEEKKVPAPSLLAYEAVTKHAPDPALGSYELLGLRDDVCFDRFGRYGVYGLGYSKNDGGSGTGRDTESSGSEEVWSESGQINYTNMDWGAAQERCYEANKHRFRSVDDSPNELKFRDATEKKSRVAVVIRLYTGFKWTEHVLLNFRALINEVALKSGGEYGVHFLLHIRDTDIPIWADEETVQEVLDENIPEEFHNMVTLWSVPQMKLMYPGNFKKPISNPSSSDIHGVYRSAHMPLQVFAVEHPEYDHIWNWEMDMRYLGNYYEFFDRIGSWATKQPRPLLWERSERYFIPSYHGTWENFTDVVKENVDSSGREAIFGPVQFPGRLPLRHEEDGLTALPETCDGEDKSKCGVGEDADFISLNPIFDADQSGWVFGLDVTGWDKPPPRRTAIITASRMSRRLLLAMHEEVWRHHHSMFTEMFPPSVALHHGLKAVYAPHPVFLDRAWYPAKSIDTAFNGGRDHSTSGHGSPFDLQNEHNHAGASWYFNSEFAGLLWRRWLGYAQMDGRGDGGGRAGEGTERGGKKEEESEEGSGRMCLRSMLVHPIKREHPTEK